MKRCYRPSPSDLKGKKSLQQNNQRIFVSKIGKHGIWFLVHGTWYIISDKSLAWVPGLTGSLGQCNACQTPVRKGNLYWRLKVILYCSSLYLSRTIVRRHMMHKVATVDWGVHLAVVYMQDPIPDPINHRRSVAKQGDPYISGIFTH